jgi:putative adenylate-forming enzyme
MTIDILLSMLRKVNTLREHERWTRTALETYQATALRELREYAYARSPFYQRFHKGLFSRPLQDLPVLTKATMMAHFDDLVTDRDIHLDAVRAHVAKQQDGDRLLNRYWVNATSGSSGHPGFFLFDRTEWVAVLASFARAHEWAGTRIGLTHRMKMASVASISPWHMSAQVGATLKSWWMPALRLAASEPLPDLVRQLNAYQPDMLVSYASMARLLAEEQVAGRLRIHPHVVYTSSEVLTDETRRRIKTAWGQEPFNQYASTETGGMAAEHRLDRRLRLFEDLVLGEIVDDQYRPVPPGEYGARLLVTTLFSRTQPLIRYELNDSLKVAATASSEVDLPFAVVEGIQGRVEDAVFLPGVSGSEVVIQPLVFNRVMDVVPASGWQVIQGDADLTVLVSGLREDVAAETIRDALSQALAAQGAVVPPIQVQHVDAIPKTAAGKAPLIKASARHSMGVSPLSSR